MTTLSDVVEAIEAVATRDALRGYAADCQDESASPSLDQYRSDVTAALGGDRIGVDRLWERACGVIAERHGEG